MLLIVYTVSLVGMTDSPGSIKAALYDIIGEVLRLEEQLLDSSPGITDEKKSKVLKKLDISFSSDASGMDSFGIVVDKFEKVLRWNDKNIPCLVGLKAIKK